MPTAGKLYLYTAKYDPVEMLEKLADYNEEITDIYVFEEISLGKRILGAELIDNKLMGTYEMDSVEIREYRGRDRVIPYTQSAKFVFYLVEEEPYLVVLGNKRLADTVANEISVLLHDQIGFIIEPILNLRGARARATEG